MNITAHLVASFFCEAGGEKVFARRENFRRKVSLKSMLIKRYFARDSDKFRNFGRECINIQLKVPRTQILSSTIVCRRVWSRSLFVTLMLLTPKAYLTLQTIKQKRIWDLIIGQVVLKGSREMKLS